jgi:uncharacterized membrane protein
MRAWLNRSYDLRRIIACLLGAISLSLLLVGWQAPARSLAFWSLGFHYPEEHTSEFQAFSKAQAQLFIQDLGSSATHLRVNVSSPAPLPERELTISYNQTPIGKTLIGQQARVLHLLVPANARVKSDGFLIGFQNETIQIANDNRQLGLLFGAFQLSELEPNLASWRMGPLLAALLSFATSLLIWRSQLKRTIHASALWLSAFTLGWAALLSYAAIQRYQLFLPNTYDLGIYDQTMWLISHGYQPFNTGMGIHLLGNHGAFILYPFALLYLIAPHVWTLLIAQVIAAGAWAIFLIGRNRQAAWAGSLIATLYLLHPSSLNLVLFDFHPDSIGATALLFALWAADQKRWRTVVLCSLVLMACKENFALTSAMLGIYLLLQGQSRLGSMLTTLSIAWFLIATKLLLPSFNNQDQSIHLIERYGTYGDSMSAIMLYFLSNPLRIVDLLFSSANLSYLLLLLAPFSLLCLLRPHPLIIALPAFLLNLLSTSGEQRSLYFHYDALIVAVMAVTSLYALIWLSHRVTIQALLPLTTLASAGALMLVFSSVDLRLLELQESLKHPSARLHYYHYALSFIPKEAAVAADMHLQPHLTHRQQAFLFPNPFNQAVYFDPAGQPFAERIDYILYDMKRSNSHLIDNDVKEDILRELQGRGLFQAILQIDGLMLLERKQSDLPERCYGRDWQANDCLALP